MSYTDSGFDKRVRNLLMAESAAAGPELPADPFYYMSAAAQFAAYGVGVRNIEPLLDSSANTQNGTLTALQRASVVSPTEVFFDGADAYVFDSLANMTLNGGFSFFVQAKFEFSPTGAQVTFGLLDGLVVSSLEFFLVDIGGALLFAVSSELSVSPSLFFGLPAPFDEYFFVECYVDGVGPNITPTVFVNGTQFVPVPPADPLTVPAGLDQYQLLCGGDMRDSSLTDRVKNIVAWNRVLTEPERVELRAWAAAQ